ncbi:MAG: hypothetical protein ACYTG0_46310, partial [Planctomycetota bacterium]
MACTARALSRRGFLCSAGVLGATAISAASHAASSDAREQHRRSTEPPASASEAVRRGIPTRPL